MLLLCHSLSLSMMRSVASLSLLGESHKAILCHHIIPYLYASFNKSSTESATKKKASIGFKITPKADKIPCLLFAYDSLLFCRTNLESCQHLDSLLNKFCQSSGQLINFHKSSLTFSKNASARDRQVVSSVFNITHQDSLGKYLRCPVFQGRPTTATFLDLVNKTSSKLQP